MSRYLFSDIAFNITDKRMPKPEDKDLYIAPNNLDTDTLSVPEYGYKVDLNGTKLIMHKGDMLFGRREPQLKKAAIAPHDGLFSAHGMIFHPNEDVIDKDFFPFFISSDYFFDAAIRISVGSLSPTVNWKDLKNLWFDIPDMAEQKRYANLLWKIIYIKRAYKELMKCSDDLVKARFIEMFGDISINDKNWEMIPLGKLCTIVRGGSPRPINRFLGGDVPWIKIGDATDGDSIYLTSTKEHIIKEGVKKSRLVKSGSLIFANCGVSLGFARIITFDGCIHDGWLAMEDVDERLNKVFLLHSLNQMTQKFRDEAPAGTQPNLNTDIMKAYMQVVPPLGMQTEFIDFAEQVDKSKFELEQSLLKLNTLYKRILLDIFSN